MGGPKRYCFVEGMRTDLHPTGDYCQVIDKKIYFRGRSDSLVKLHGEKIFLCALERVAKKFLDVDCLHALSVGERIVVFVCGQDESEVCEHRLRQIIFRQLGSLYVPHIVRQLQTKPPINKHGKIDTLALSRWAAEQMAPPCRSPSATQDKIRQLWHLFTGAAPVEGRSFLASGGDSLAALRFSQMFLDWCSATGSNYSQGQLLLLLTNSELDLEMVTAAVVSESAQKGSDDAASNSETLDECQRAANEEWLR